MALTSQHFFVWCLLTVLQVLSPVHMSNPSDNSNDGEWWPDEVDLTTVTISNMIIDSKPGETDGERVRYREITVDSSAGESVVNPDDWPNVDLKPSNGSVKGQTMRGPWR